MYVVQLILRRSPFTNTVNTIVSRAADAPATFKNAERNSENYGTQSEQLQSIPSQITALQRTR